MPLRNVATTFTIEQQRLEINALAGDVNNIATGVTAVANATTAVNATNATTAATANALAASATGADLTLSGTLTVNGSQTILNTATLEVEDKNIIIAKGSTTDAAASGGGITLKGADDKTISYNQTGDKWEANKPFEASNLLYNSGNQELNGHLAVNTTDNTIANNGPFVVHIDTDKNIGYSGGLSEIGNVPGVVAFHDTGALQDLGMRGITLRFATGSAERLRITDSELTVTGCDISLTEGKKTIFGSNSGNGAYIKHQSGHLEIKNETGWCYWDNVGSIRIRTGSSYGTALTISNSDQSATFGGTVSDPKGDLRSIPQNVQSSSSNYDLVASDAGKCIIASGNVTFNAGIFSAGDAVTIINNTNSDITIVQGNTVLYYTADGTNASRTLGTRGIASIYFTHNTTGYISGAQLS